MAYPDGMSWSRRTSIIAALALAACGAASSPQTPLAPRGSDGPSLPSVVAADAGPSARALPARGKPCTTAISWTCLGASTVGACIDGVWTHSRCRGPAGCRPEERLDATCDESIAEEGETCLVASDVTCSPDRTRMLRCVEHAWRLGAPCSGELGCVPKATKVSCDNSISALGDPCLEEDDYACAADHRTALKCSGGRFGVISRCHGPKGCSIDRRTETTNVVCDDSLSTLGDPCEATGHYACTPDQRSILVCKSRTYALDSRCKSKEKCEVRGELVGCY